MQLDTSGPVTRRLLLTLLAVVTTATACATPPHPDQREQPLAGIAVVYPIQLPPGYQFIGYGDTHSENGVASMHSIQLAPARGSRGNVISICAEVHGDRRECSTGDSDEIHRKFQSAYITIRALGGEPLDNDLHAFLKAVPLTTDPSAATWLDS